jgi:predicted CopG family antitoxin
MPKQASRQQKSRMKTLKIGQKTHDRLKKHGQFGESFEDVINRLMDVVDERIEEYSARPTKDDLHY